MNSVFGMQRANGDWFALQQSDGMRVPIFSSDIEAKQARAFNVEMLVFKSVLLDERALKDLARSVNEPRTYFWLVEKGSTSMRRGTALNHSELVRIISDGLGRELGTEE